MSKYQRSLAIYMLLWSGFYMAVSYKIMSVVGWEQVINNSQSNITNTTNLTLAFLLVLSAIYMAFSLLVSTYKASPIYRRVVKYGPVLVAILITTAVINEFQPHPIKSMSEISFAGTVAIIGFQFMPWWLAFSSYHFVKKNVSTAT